LTDARRGRASVRRNPVPASPTRLDLLVNPYGPSLRVQEAIASSDDLHLQQPLKAERLRLRIAELHAVPPRWVTLGNGIDELLAALLRMKPGPVALFPPTDPDQARLAALLGKEIIEIPRSHRFAIEVDPTSLELPNETVGLAQSPNDPTGTILSAQEAVRLSRKCTFLIIDERHSAYSPRTLLPLVREFENVVVLRTFETWAGLSGFPIAYAVAPPKLAAALDERRLRPWIATASLIAADATFDDLPYVFATVERVRDEKARLFRTLRKLNMVRPFPSWANFLMAHVERGEIAEFESELANRDIVVHRPQQQGLEGFFRISATTAEATAALKNALIAVAATL
jgi:histidinol-phosphate aminotransferase